MLSINTNLSSLIAQSSMKKATFSLNQAVERMTTGFKINHAKDNAAGYGISTQMQTKLYAYDVAADNVAMGMDLVTTASDTISMMQDHATRLRDLATQARNGTYGSKSLEAINAEVGAILSELNRLYNTAEYNKVSLFNHKAYELSPEHQALTESLEGNVTAKAEYGGFIDDPKTYEDSYVDNLTSVTSAINGAGLQANKEYKVSSKEDLQALATFVNGGGNTENMTFILAGDIDLSSVSNWTPIGNNSTSSARFKGTFDGNGHKIKNLTINNPTAGYQGLFGHAESPSTIQNVGIEGAKVKGQDYVGALAGLTQGSITNSYATGDVSGQGNYVGGLAGSASDITNSYATGVVSGNNDVGGLAGSAYGGDIINSYATGDVSGQGNFVGGLAGSADGDIINSYATGDVNGNDRVGGLLGFVECGESIINNTYATGDVNGNDRVGGLVGYAYEGDDSHMEIYNSFASGNIQGKLGVGGIIGYIETYCDPFDNFTIDNCTSYSKSISGDEAVGSIVGQYVGEEANGYCTPTDLIMTNCSTISSLQGIGGYYKCDSDNSVNIADPTHDLSSYNSSVTHIQAKNVTTSLQVGINSDESCRLSFDTNFDLDLGGLSGDITSDETLGAIDEFLKMLSEKATSLGAVQNRLESAIESIEVNMNNLTSSLSTIRDADIAEESSEYIRQQILQQASATLLATANQSPSIALQLI